MKFSDENLEFIDWEDRVLVRERNTYSFLEVLRDKSLVPLPDKILLSEILQSGTLISRDEAEKSLAGLDIWKARLKTGHTAQS